MTKHITQLYRTINGDRYEAWQSFPSPDRVAEYRAAGVRCRRQGEELFVHKADFKLAAEVDFREDA